MTDIHQQQEKAIDLLIDLNKWIAGLTFGSATGCVAILKNGAASNIRIYLISAILFFAFSILISSFIFILLPAILQKLPVQHKSNITPSLYDYRLLPHLSLRHLITAQYVFFVLGIVFVFLWVLLGK